MPPKVRERVGFLLYKPPPSKKPFDCRLLTVFVTLSLNPQLMSDIGLVVPSDSGISTPLTGRDCVQLVQLIPLECVEAYSHFLTGLVKAELKGVQRGVVYSALREAQLPSQIERIMHSVKELLPSLCTANLAKDVASVGLIKG